MNVFQRIYSSLYTEKEMKGIGGERKATLSIADLYRNLRLYRNRRSKSNQTVKDKERDKIARQIVDDFLI